jgi:hypothetical protein
MTNSFRPHKNTNGSSQLVFSAKAPRTHGDVVQDKNGVHGVRFASAQPAQGEKGGRTQQVSKHGARTQTPHVHQRGLVPLMIHVECVYRDEIARRANTNALLLKNGKRQSLSLSEVARPIFKKGLQADIDLQYGAMLEPILDKIHAKNTRGLRSFLMLILSRLAFDIGQTRAIVTNILVRQPGMTQTALDDILSKSGETAADNITRITPQISGIMQSVKEWLQVTEEVQPPSAVWQSSKPHSREAKVQPRQTSGI